jgi:hypothetical protein
LVLSTIRSKRSDGKTELKLTGRYEHADKIVHLHGLTIKGARRKLAAKQNRSETSPKRPSGVFSNPAVSLFAQPQQGPAPIEGGDPGYDYYYSQGEMTKSDGTTLVNSTYEYNQATSQNLFTITLAGVAFSGDLNTYELSQPVSDAQLQQVEAWLNSDDGLLARQTGIALIQEGYQQPDNEALLIYYLIALAIDASSEQARFGWTGSCELRSHHGMQNCGCCGPGCFCIPTRMGTPIYGSPCTTHDNCSVANRSRFARPCLRSLFASVVYTIGRWSGSQGIAP